MLKIKRRCLTIFIFFHLNRCSQRELEAKAYNKSKGLLSVAITDEISLQNEKEQNCCNNEIVISNNLENNSHAISNNSTKNQSTLHTKKKNRDTSEKLR